MRNWKGEIMIKYSILVPVYNKVEYLKKYFKYIQNQTYENYEVIVVDDCSSDGSYDYLKGLNDPRVHVYRNENNVGLGENRNILLNHAHGEYVIFVDPDDYIELDLLSKIDEENDSLDVIRFQNVIEPVTEHQKELEKNKDKYRYGCDPTEVITGEEALIRWCLGERKINTFPWTYAIKRKLYEDVVYPNTSILEDFAITPYLIAKSKRVKAIQFVGYHYMKYDDSLSNNDGNLENKKNKLALFKKIIELAEYYINKTDISGESKRVFINDIHNRYTIREQKILELEKRK